LKKCRLSSGNWHFQIIIFQTELQVWQIGNLVQKQDDLLLCFLAPDPSCFAVTSQREGVNLTPQM
jgi:hypothetical protein